MEDFNQDNVTQDNISNEEPYSAQETIIDDTDAKKPVMFKTNSWIFHLLSIFGLVFMGMFFLCQIYLTPIQVVGLSMLPGINASAVSDSDKSHCDMVYYRKKATYEYGDVIILSNEQKQYIDNSNITYLIKRVIACPGDTITFYLTDVDYSKKLYYYDIKVTNANGEQINLDENSYIKEKMYFNLNTVSIYSGLYLQIMPNIIDNTLGIDNRFYSLTINEGCYFVMGDNRNNSTDSRYFGEVKQEDLAGSVRLQVKFGQNIWISLLHKLKSLLSYTNIYTKELI